jgi:hypothetical protein
MASDRSASAEKPTTGRRQGAGAFLTAAAGTAAALVLAGWVTGMRQVMHAALLTFAVAALFPFVLIAGALLLVLLTAFVLVLAGLGGGDGIPVGDGAQAFGEGAFAAGGWLIPRYYRFLARRRHPAFWGLAAGVLSGGLLLWVLIALIVIPGETRTVRRLTETKALIEKVYDETGRFPRPDTQGHLLLEERGGAGTAASGPAITDGFGRPLRYEVLGEWKLASWSLTSSGFDGDPSADDLCVSGSTKLMEWGDKGAHLVRLLENIRAGSAPLDDHLAGIRILSCPPR